MDPDTILSTESSSDDIKFWDLRMTSEFENISRSDIIDQKNRKAPKYGQREEKMNIGSL